MTKTSEHPVLQVAVLVGSLRAQSFSRKIARALAARAPDALRCRFVEIGELPLYNEDLENEAPPAAWSSFRGAIRECDAVLFVTPEYNRSIPGCLKNALDVGSRPSGKSVFKGLPAGVVSVTPNKLGAFGANHALRQTFVFLDMPVMQQPEAYIGNVAELLDDNGAVKNGETAAFLENFMGAFETWVKTVRPGSSSFGAFMKQREKIAEDYVNGNAASLKAIVTHSEPATFFSPRGDRLEGADAVVGRYERDAASFRQGGSTNLEVLQAGASGELAFWTGLQHAKARMGKNGQPAEMTLRITEVFRLEDGGFKLVHRHADPADQQASA
jgi:NAD(P)H-dependent FMN reductase/ketosteroid isomerase-like protein